MIKKIILASASPRRKELLEQIGITFDIVPSRKEEIVAGENPADIVKELSYQKAMDIADNTEDGSIIIGADTMVAIGNELLGKPKNKDHAFKMLKDLQSNTHQVYTGVTVVHKSADELSWFTFYEKTDVIMYAMTDEEIENYISTGEPLDKAGAYGIQGMGAAYIQRIEGDYNNVVGLPIAKLYQEMKNRGFLI